MSIKEITKNGRTIFQVYVNGIDRLGKRVQMRRDCESRQIAKRMENDLVAQLRHLKERPTSVLWEDWVEYSIEKLRPSRLPTTMVPYTHQVPKWVTPYWRGRKINSITPIDVEEIVFKVIPKELSDRTRKTVLGLVRKIFSIAVSEGILVRNPADGIRVRVYEKEKFVLTSREAEELLLAAKMANHEFYLIWAVALMTGLRSGEMFALRVADIDLDNNLLSVNKQWQRLGGERPTKTRTNRTVPISGDLRRLLIDELKVQFRQPGEHLLHHPREWKTGEQSKVLRVFCKELGITQIRFHDLRATFITNLLAQGVSVPLVMKIVGHTRLKTHDSYLRLSGIEVKGVTDKLSYAIPQTTDANVIPLRR